MGSDDYRGFTGLLSSIGRARSHLPSKPFFDGGLGRVCFSRLLLGNLGLEGFLPGGGVAIKVSKARYGEGTADLVFFLNSV